MKGSINLTEMMKDITIVANTYGVELKGRRRFECRLWLGLNLIRLGALVAGMGYEAREEVNRQHEE